MKEGQRCPMPRFAPHRSQLVSPKTKKRWTVADAQAVVTRMAASGLSVREFAEAEGLEAQRIYRNPSTNGVLKGRRTGAAGWDEGGPEVPHAALCPPPFAVGVPED